MANNTQTISDVIVKKAQKGKFVECINSLNLAYLEDYAMVHGAGGADHAPLSGISVAITDYGAKEKTGASTYVKANVPCFVFDQILTVCRKNVGNEDNGLGGVYNSLAIITNGIGTFLNEGCIALKRIITGKGASDKGPLADAGIVFRAALDAISSGGNVPRIKTFTDYTYHQDRVNMYKVDPKDGFVSVTTLDILRQQPTNDRQNPWMIKVTNFYAKEKKEPNGTSSYVANTIRDKKEAFIYVSDDDMYDLAFKVTHFINVWEQAMGRPLVLNALRKKEEMRQNANAQQREEGYQGDGYGQQPGGYSQNQGQPPANSSLQRSMNSGFQQPTNGYQRQGYNGYQGRQG